MVIGEVREVMGEATVLVMATVAMVVEVVEVVAGFWVRLRVEVVRVVVEAETAEETCAIPTVPPASTSNGSRHEG